MTAVPGHVVPDVEALLPLPCPVCCCYQTAVCNDVALVPLGYHYVVHLNVSEGWNVSAQRQSRIGTLLYVTMLRSCLLATMVLYTQMNYIDHYALRMHKGYSEIYPSFCML